MGVMGCSRNGCAHILCESYIEDFGYICESCKREYVEFVRNRHGELCDMSRGEFHKLLKEFNETKPGDEEKISIYRFLE